VTRFERFAAAVVAVSFGLTWPLLDLLGRNPQFFLAHRSGPADVVLTALAVTAVGLLAGLPALLPGRAGRAATGIVVTGGSAALAVQVFDRLPATETKSAAGILALAGAVVVGALVARTVSRVPSARTVVKYLSVAPVAFLAYFLLSSPAATLVARADTLDPVATTVNRPAPLVVLVFDEFPVAALMDAEGTLRGDRYPSFARLAGDGIWFRNAVTVAQQTDHSVPAILTGLNPPPASIPVAGEHPFNLFSLLSGTYDLRVTETITELCAACGSGTGYGYDTRRWRAIGSDLTVLTGHLLLPASLTDGLPPIDEGWGNFGAASTGKFDTIARFRAQLEADPRAPLDRLVADIGPAGDRPPFYFVHALVPHHPWQFLPSGQRYLLESERSPGTTSTGWGPDPFLVDLGRQRLLLQVGYTDHALGRVLDALDAAGLYDDALVVVTADHGISVRPGVEHQRTITPESVGEIAAVPLFVKLPGNARAGEIADDRALTVDVVPTVADVLGIDLPWEPDGSSLLALPPRAETTTRGPSGSVTYGTDGSEKLAYAAAIEESFPGGDPYALAPDGTRALLGRRVDTLDLGESIDADWRLDRPAWFADVDPRADAVPALVRGTVDLPPGTTVGIVVNGVVAATTRTYDDEGRTRVWAMIPVTALVPGDNDVDLLVVSGATTERREPG